MPKLNILGHKYGLLTVLEELPTTAHYTRNYLCKCDCGNETKVTQSHLRSGHTTSCGCVVKHNLITGKCRRTHGEAKSKLYKVWAQMHQRCSNPEDAGYYKYGAKGVTVCPEWETYEPFKEWAGSQGYKEGLTIDRINVYREYSPKNCKWVPKSKQGINIRKNSRNTSGYVGVSFHASKQKWIARVTVDGTRKEIGRFDSALEAHNARGNYFKENNLDEQYKAYQLQESN